LPLGPSPQGPDAVNFALWSKNATHVTLCMCVAPGQPTRALPLSPPLTTSCASFLCAQLP